MNDTTLPKQSGDPKHPRRRASNGSVLRPGFGLHDWMTLLHRAKDLAQRGVSPLRRDIPPSEVRLHDKPHDGWVTLRGKVYNLSPYLAYHPGGDEILRPVLGKDATVLFDRYHRWVNVDNLIGPLLLGTLRVEGRGASIREDGGSSEDDGGAEDAPDGDDDRLVVPSASAQASQSTDGLGSFAMPKPRPARGDPVASLPPPRHDDVVEDGNGGHAMKS
jgi:cytochrome b involved in lipid metabolism